MAAIEIDKRWAGEARRQSWAKLRQPYKQEEEAHGALWRHKRTGSQLPSGCTVSAKGIEVILRAKSSAQSQLEFVFHVEQLKRRLKCHQLLLRPRLRLRLRTTNSGLQPNGSRQCQTLFITQNKLLLIKILPVRGRSVWAVAWEISIPQNQIPYWCAASVAGYVGERGWVASSFTLFVCAICVQVCGFILPKRHPSRSPFFACPPTPKHPPLFAVLHFTNPANWLPSATELMAWH